MKEFRIFICLLFIDFRCAYDSHDRVQMYVAMNELNIPQKLISLVKMIMSNMKNQIKIQLKLSAPCIIHKGFQQGDTLACLLFNITLEYAIRKSGIQTRGTIFYKWVQLMAYADGIVTTGRSLAPMKEGSQLLEEASKEVGLVINEGKTKYSVAANTQNCSKTSATEIGRYNSERGNSFMYLGSLATGDNNVSEEITNYLIAANRSYFGQSQFKSQLLSRKTKIFIYITLVRPILIYTTETWTTTKNDERRLSIFKRRILHRIHGPICERG